MSEVAPRSLRESWDAASRQARVLFFIPFVIIALSLALIVALPGGRAGAFRNLALSLVLLLNQVVVVFLTPAQQKRVQVPQMLFLFLMIVYMFAPLIGVVHQSSGTMPWDLLLVSFVPVLLFVLRARRTNTK